MSPAFAPVNVADEDGRGDVAQGDRAGEIGAGGARCPVEHGDLALIGRGRAAAEAGRADQDVAEAVVVEVAGRADREPGLAAAGGPVKMAPGTCVCRRSRRYVGRLMNRHAVGGRGQAGRFVPP